MMNEKNHRRKRIFKSTGLLIVAAIFLTTLGTVYADDIDGTEGNDTLIGTNNDDTINGYGGVDWIFGEGGADTINAGAGNDVVTGGTGNDVIYGDDGDDVLMGAEGDDEIHGGEGDDLVYASDGNDLVYGDGGDDIVNGYSGDDVIYGGDGNDQLGGGWGDDIIYGGEGDDQLNGYWGDDEVYGEAGNDEMEGDIGNDILDGGDGNDTISGGDDDDELTGGAGDDIVNGDAGNDTIYTSEGQDTIDGGDDDDTIYVTGDNGNGSGSETYATGGTGTNIFIFLANTTGNLILESQNDGTTTDTEDTLDFSQFGESVNINLSLLDVVQQVASSLSITLKGLFTNLIGSSEDDTLIGNELENTIQGNDGSDTIDGGAGVDDLYGGDLTDGVGSYDTSDGYDIDLTSSDPNNHEDVWHSIEWPQPKPPSNDPVVPGGGITVIDVYSGEQVQLPCGTECVKVRIKDEDSDADGSYAVFCNMCENYVTIEEETKETLRIRDKVDVTEFKDPKTFEDHKFDVFKEFKEMDPRVIMGMTVRIFDSSKTELDRVPPQGTMRVGYPVKPEQMEREDDFYFHRKPYGMEEWDKLPSRITEEDYRIYDEHYDAYTDAPGTFIHLDEEIETTI